MTQLRQNTYLLAQTLIQGKSVKLIYRSKIIGEIVPRNSERVFNAGKFLASYKGLRVEDMKIKKREKKYRETLEKKYKREEYL